jgi:cytoskeletal protein RodZ
MAQTKTKSPKSKRSSGASTKRASKGASRSSKARSKSSSTTKRKPASSKSKSKSRSTGTRSKSSRSKPSAPKGKDRSTLDKMKVPATAAGATLLAVAGGMAATRNGSKGGLLGGRGKSKLPSPRSGLKSIKKIDLKKIDLPKPEEAIDWVEEKAKGVGDAGYRVADLTSQARSVRRAVAGDD